jgi:nicotinamidase-related amidase
MLFDQAKNFIRRVTQKLLGARPPIFPSKTALVIINPHRATTSLASDIETTAEQFRNHAMPVFLIDSGAPDGNTLRKSGFATAENDVILDKSGESFGGVSSYLAARGFNKLLVCGVPLAKDVFNFAAQANGKHHVTVLHDLTAHDSLSGPVPMRQTFKQAGIELATSRQKLNEFSP